MRHTRTQTGNDTGQIFSFYEKMQKNVHFFSVSSQPVTPLDERERERMLSPKGNASHLDESSVDRFDADQFFLPKFSVPLR